MFNTEQANCTSLDPELFFPVGEMKKELAATLKRICFNCPIMDNCLEYALHVKVSGYWAGTNERERERLRKMFNIEAVRIDEQYKSMFQVETSTAKRSRTYRERLKEAG
jgi:WhiB family redox-sensing transcriptional regulator